MAGKADGSIVIDTKVDTKGFDAGSSELLSAMKSLSEQLKQLGDLINTVFTSSSQQISNAAQNAAEGQQDLNEEVDQSQNSFNNGRKGIDEYLEMVERFAATCESFDTGTVEEAKGVVADLESQLEEFGNTEFDIDDKIFMGTAAPHFQQMAEALQLLKRELAIAVYGPEWVAFQEKWQGMATLSGMIKNSFAGAFQGIIHGVRTAGAAISTVVSHPIQALDRGLAAVVSGAGRATRALGGLIASGISAGLRKIGNAAKTAAGNLARMASTAMVNGIKKLGGSMFGLNRAAKQTGPSIASPLKSLIQFSIGLFSLRKALDWAKEGFGNLLQQDKGFAATFNTFMQALTNLKNSLAAAFLPIAEIVLPLLTTMINYITAAVSKVGQLIAALTGKNTFQTAAADQKDYVAEMNKNTKATKKNTKETKKNQKTIAGFDDINILKDKDKDATPAAAQPASFQTLPISKEMSGLADKLKDMWKNADFTELGRMLGEKLKKALESIPWDKIKSVLRKIAKSIATFLNGFLETPGLFTVIGKTIAEALNSAFEFVESFVSNFHWDSLGKAIHDGILGFTDNIDWGLIFKTMAELGTGIGTALETAFDNPEIWNGIFTTIANRFNAMFLLLDSFITAINWGSLAKNIALGLNDGVNTFDWDLLAQTVIDGVNAVFDFVYNFVTTFDFKNLGTKIGESITKAVQGIDWATGGAALAGALNGLLQFLTGLVQSTDWGAIGRAIMTFIASFLGNFDWAGLGEFLSACLIGLLDLFMGIYETIDWNTLPDKIMTAIGEFIGGFDWATFASKTVEFLFAALEASFQMLMGMNKIVGDIIGSAVESAKDYFQQKIEECGGNVVLGILKGIVDGLASIVSWVKANIFTPIINAFKSAFGIASPSKVMATLGKDLVNGMYQGILSIMSGIGSWIRSHIFNPFISHFKSLFSLGSGAASVMGSRGKELMTDLRSGIGSLVENVKDKMSDLASGMKKAFNGAVKWLDIGKNIIDGIGDGISDGWDWLTDKAWDLASDVFDSACRALGISSPSRKFRWIAEMMTAGLTDGIEDTGRNAVSSVSSLADALTQEAEKADPMISIGSDLPDGLDGVLTAFSDRIITGFENLIDAMDRIANGSSFLTPALASGAVPYAARKGASNAGGMGDLSGMIAQISGDRLTKDELKEVLDRALQENVNIDFYIGDEQVARHANAGNARLDRRYRSKTL